MRQLSLGFAVVLLVSACGGSGEAEYPDLSGFDDGAESAPEGPPGTLARSEVVTTVDRGLGRFLQRVEVEPHLPGGKFQGFRIVDLRPTDFWMGVDLKPGDVVTEVNGMPIGRDVEAYAAFQSLKKASELRVTYLRGGLPRELVFRIVDDPASPTPAKSAPEPAPKPASKPAPKPAPNERAKKSGGADAG